MSNFWFIMILIGADIVFGFLWYFMFFSFGESLTPGFEKFKRPYRILIRLLFVIFWPVYFVVSLLYAMVDLAKGAIRSFLE
jgi:hypothetical protein